MSDKMTKSEMYAAIEEVLLEKGEGELAAFCAKEREALAVKAQKAHDRAQAKKEEFDELGACVASALTAEFQTGNEIYAAVGDENEDGWSLGKVRARLTKLVKSGVAVKDEVKVTTGDKTRTVMGYKLA